MHPVLVIDPHEDSRLSIVELLRASGYTTIGVSNGEMALRMLRSGLRPCVILLELLIPGNGSGFRRAQRADPELASIPVIGGGTTRKAQENLDPDSHVEHYLLKPFDIDELLGIVRRYCAA